MIRQRGLRLWIVLQMIQIMVGLFNIGLGPGRTSTHPGDLTSLGAAYWLGAVVNTWSSPLMFVAVDPEQVK